MSEDLDNLFDDLESFDKVEGIEYEMAVEYADPRTLKANPWNPNSVDPINQMKLEASIKKDGIKRPVVVRTLADGSLEIIGGQHRTLAAINLRMELVPIINRGEISDAQAKKETLLDNYRYGSDDIFKFTELLQDPDLGSADELLATMPIDEEELASYFSHLTSDDLSVDIDAALEDKPEEAKIDLATPARTHQIIRFRVSIEDSANIAELMKATRAEQGFTESDDMTNDGDALVYLLSQLTKR